MEEAHLSAGQRRFGASPCAFRKLVSFFFLFFFLKRVKYFCLPCQERKSSGWGCITVEGFAQDPGFPPQYKHKQDYLLMHVTPRLGDGGRSISGPSSSSATQQILGQPLNMWDPALKIYTDTSMCVFQDPTHTWACLSGSVHFKVMLICSVNNHTKVTLFLGFVYVTTYVVCDCHIYTVADCITHVVL